MVHIRTLMDQMIQIDEGRMKDIFTMDQEGQSVKEIAKRFYSRIDPQNPLPPLIIRTNNINIS